MNVGAGQEISIRDLVALVQRATGWDGEVIWDAPKPDGQPRRCIDTTRALRGFGFRARTPLLDGIARTVAWYEERHGVAAGSVAGTR